MYHRYYMYWGGFPATDAFFGEVVTPQAFCIDSGDPRRHRPSRSLGRAVAGFLRRATRPPLARASGDSPVSSMSSGADASEFIDSWSVVKGRYECDHRPWSMNERAAERSPS